MQRQHLLSEILPVSPEGYVGSQAGAKHKDSSCRNNSKSHCVSIRVDYGTVMCTNTALFLLFLLWLTPCPTGEQMRKAPKLPFLAPNCLVCFQLVQLPLFFCVDSSLNLVHVPLENGEKEERALTSAKFLHATHKTVVKAVRTHFALQKHTGIPQVYSGFCIRN